MLEAGFVVLSNNMFHQISDKVRIEYGLPVSDKVFKEWREWCLGAVERL
jgi:hypothetical protein